MWTSRESNTMQTARYKMYGCRRVHTPEVPFIREVLLFWSDIRSASDGPYIRFYNIEECVDPIPESEKFSPMSFIEQQVLQNRDGFLTTSEFDGYIGIGRKDGRARHWSDIYL